MLNSKNRENFIFFGVLLISITMVFLMYSNFMNQASTIMNEVPPKVMPSKQQEIKHKKKGLQIFMN